MPTQGCRADDDDDDDRKHVENIQVSLKSNKNNEYMNTYALL
jgi:hypothetical protein